MRAFCLLLLAATALQAGHSETDLFFPIAGRATGAGGLTYSTALWVTNVSTTPAKIRIEFLRTNETNPSPTPFAEELVLRPGQSRSWENVNEDPLRVEGLGALRIRSDIAVIASARLYSRREGETGAASLAMSYSGIPARFAIGQGESTVLQGVSQNPEFRYNVSMVETTGHLIGLRLLLRDADGTVLGRRGFQLRGLEQRTASIASLFPGASISNGVLVAEAATGGGKAILIGSQVAAQSADGSAFEMSVRPAQRAFPSRGELAIFVIAAAALLAVVVVASRRR